MELAPVAASELRARVRRFGRHLAVADPAGQLVVEARLRGAAKPGFAVFRTSEGEWRVEREDPFLPPGPRRSWRRDQSERFDVFDSDARTVATLRNDQLTLEGGETLDWSDTTLTGADGELLAARQLWPRRRGLRVELTAPMLARQDRAFLIGVAAILAHHFFARARATGGAIAGVVGP